MKSNYHTHTTFCDGAATPEEMVEGALRKGFDILGFSSHSEMLVSEKAYREEIARLKEKYRGRIKILCGIEADWPCPLDLTPYDYVIGSLHFVPTPSGARAPVDESVASLMKGIRDFFNNDATAFVKAYFEAERALIREGRYTFLGHVDLVRKFNEKHPFFDEGSAWYREELVRTADLIAERGARVEINTGGMARGWLSDAYPSRAFRDLLTERGVPFLLNADAHSVDALDYAFEQYSSYPKIELT